MAPDGDIVAWTALSEEVQFWQMSPENTSHSAFGPNQDMVGDVSFSLSRSGGHQAGAGLDVQRRELILVTNPPPYGAYDHKVVSMHFACPPSTGLPTWAVACIIAAAASVWRRRALSCCCGESAQSVCKSPWLQPSPNAEAQRPPRAAPQPPDARLAPRRPG